MRAYILLGAHPVVALGADRELAIANLERILEIALAEVRALR